MDSLTGESMSARRQLPRCCMGACPARPSWDWQVETGHEPDTRIQRGMNRLFQKSSCDESDVVSWQVVTANRRRDGARANKNEGLRIAEPGSRALADRNRGGSAQLREFPEHPARDITSVGAINSGVPGRWPSDPVPIHGPGRGSDPYGYSSVAVAPGAMSTVRVPRVLAWASATRTVMRPGGRVRRCSFPGSIPADCRARPSHWGKR